MVFFLKLANSMYRYIDKGFLELFGPLGATRTVHYLSYYLESFSTGFIPHYAFVFLLSI
jgi:hypothetical protein